MAERAYRVGYAYWILSSLVIVSLLSIPIVILLSIPGAPQPSVALTKWRVLLSVRPIDASSLLAVWIAIVLYFSYLVGRSIRALVKPRILRGIVEQVQDIQGRTNTFWIQLSGTRHQVRYEKRLYAFLKEAEIVGTSVELKSGVGQRIVSVDASS